MPDVVEKICVTCKKDVSRLERSKDAKGRYWCMACYKAAVARQKAHGTPAGAVAASAAASPPGGGAAAVGRSVAHDVFADLPDQKACPGCQIMIHADAVVCMNCGYNMETGRASRTSVRTISRSEKAMEKAAGAGAKGAGSVGGALGGLLNSPTTMFVLALGCGMLPLLAFASTDLLLPAAIAWNLIGLGLCVWVFIQAFFTSIASGVLLAVTLLIPLVNLVYWLYFIFWRNESTLLKVVYGGFLVGSITMMLIAAGGGLPGMDELLASSEAQRAGP